MCGLMKGSLNQTEALTLEEDQDENQKMRIMVSTEEFATVTKAENPGTRLGFGLNVKA